MISRRTYTLTTLLIACGPVSAPPATGATTIDTTDTTGTPDTTAAPPDPTTPTTAPHDPTSTTEISTGADTTSLTSFVLSPDNGSDFDCDIFAQDCPAGQKCAAYAEIPGSTWSATQCVPVTGSGAPGEPCTVTDDPFSGLDDCAFGSMCWNIDADNHGTCFGLCTGSEQDPTCPPEHTCPLASDGLINLCHPWCDPLADECAPAELCVPTSDAFVCIFDASGDEGQLNGPCEFTNACDPGLACLNTAAASSACMQGATGCCQPFCELPDAPCPNPDQQCLPWFDGPIRAPAGLEHIGFCGIPE